MLDTIKSEIRKAELDTTEFADFYQQYIMSVQDDILDKEIQSFRSHVQSIDNINDVMKGIDTLSKELT